MAALLVLVALAVAGCSSSSSEPSATFTGAACNYDGPSEFDLNSTVTFTVTNDSDIHTVGFAVWKFPEGTTSEEIYDEGIFNVVKRNILTLRSSPTTPGEEYELTSTFNETGQHGINCFVFPGPTTESDHVTMFEVNG